MKWIFGLGLYALLLGGGFLLGQHLPLWLDVPDDTGALYGVMTFAVLGIFLVASAIPFVPGAEIGFALMMVFGARIALLVYASMVAALWLAFGVGQLFPKSILRRLFQALRMTRAADLVAQAETMTDREMRSFLTQNAPGSVLPFLMKNKYLAIALLLNVPGNSLLGGGGGIALFAGMSRIYSPRKFCVASALAVAPVPILFLVFGYHP